MSIFVDQNTKVVYQGLTGSQGRYYGLLNRDYGTQVVAGTNPKKAGEDVDGIPIFASVADAVAETGANGVVHLHPGARGEGCRDGGRRGRHRVHRVITEGVPAQDEAWFYNELERNFPSVQLLGPNCPGIISPGKCNIGITAGEIAKPGGPSRHRQPLRHADLSGALRAQAPGHRRDHLRRHRWRPGARHQLHRLPRALRGRSRDQGRHDDRRDRRLGRGRGGGVHRREDDQADVGLHRRCDRPPRQEDGPRRRHRLRVARAPPRPRWKPSRRPGSRSGKNPTEAGELMVDIVRNL